MGLERKGIKGLRGGGIKNFRFVIFDFGLGGREERE